MASRLVDRVAYPEVRRAGEHDRAHVMPACFSASRKAFALLFVVDDVVRGAPGEEKCRAVVPGRDMGKRRSVE